MARQTKGSREFENVAAYLDGDPGTRARIAEISALMGGKGRNGANEATQTTGMDVLEGDFTGFRDPVLEEERLEARRGETWAAIGRSAAATAGCVAEMLAIARREDRMLDALGPRGEGGHGT